ncbi:RNA polymerase II-associated protein 1-like [Anneissia japonica]|uniref:RNA polymerase II-associated protein 1-like n=1 Tax=Anneissia japonica TaxID=1529436 RepID=UPI001425656E|nr:RNA polymerase II-associated protein 1-like [Anneissia japonica]XP_033105371.1 RNA polymerase II-associated protein 1-like [Anneissia japonica]XP_033105372.1 RNA polymerase II-associated protein 1-like [Anneissia japonica]XP_033105373.1 RNA polymerase II-associated protein 1-like [Anneissia japonica]
MIKRPKPGENEDDLLKLQEEFLKNKVNPSVTVFKAGDKRKAEGSRQIDSVPEKHGKVKRDVVQMSAGLSGMVPPRVSQAQKKKSRFKEERSKMPDRRSERIIIDLDGDQDPHEAMDAQDSDLRSVLTQIMERDVRNVPVYLPSSTTQGFPTVLHRGHSSSTATLGKKKSLFAQQVESCKPSSFGVSVAFPPVTVMTLPQQSAAVDESRNRNESSSSSSTSRSNIVSGEGLQSKPGKNESSAIHKENVKKIESMSEEILEEQKKLLSTLDPNIVKFLQSKKGLPQSGAAVPMETNQENIREHIELSTEDKDKTIPSNKLLEEENDVEASKPIEVKEEWVNMAEVETEKLAWLKDLPKPKAKSKEGCLARFDFNGRLLARDADVPVREGLHHHGDEQEVAGYTIEELFMLSRSTVQSQRVIGLQTLARIVYSYRIDDIGGELQKPLIPMLLESGFIFLVRWALDDSSEVVIGAAVEALASFLINPGDEETLDNIYFWSHGCEVPCLVPTEAEEENDEDDEEDQVGNKPEDASGKPDKPDAEVVNKDVVMGLLKMNVLPRLRYILEVVRPPAAVVLNVLTVLIRMARHSPQTANEIYKCPRLIDTVVTLFMPTTSWVKQGDLVTDVYNYPVIPAVKLLRVLCLTGRNLAASLLSKYSLVSVIIRYISVEPTDMQMNIGEAYNLSIETFRLWHVLISYGLSCDAFRELYPLFMQQLQLFQRLSVLPLSVTEEPATVSAHHLQLLRASAIFCVLEATVNAAGTTAHLQSQLNRSHTRPTDEPVLDQVAPPPINWSHVTGLLGPVELCFQKWMAEMSRAELNLEREAMTLAGCCINFLTSFYGKLTMQTSHNAVECLEHLEVLITGSLIPLMTSSAFYSFMLNLRNHSSCNFKQCKSKSSHQLPDFGCHMDNDQVLHPCIQRQSTVGIMGSLFKLTTTILRIHKGMTGKFCAIVESNHVIGYLEKVTKKRLTTSSRPASWFSRFEHHVLFLLLKLYYLVAQQSDSCHQHSNLYHSIALVLFTSLHAGDEHLAHELLSTMLFHTDFIIEGKVGDPIAADLADFLTTSNTTRQQSVSKNVGLESQPEVSRGELLQDAYGSLATIRSTYMVFFARLEQDVLASRARANHIPHEIQNFVLPAHTGQLAPTDWMFMPLLHLYSETQTAEMLGKSVQSFPTHITNTVINSLRWIFIMETWRGESLKVVPLAAKMTRLFCLFLTGNDLFFEDQVRSYLTQLMRMYTSPSWEQQLDFNIPIPGVASFPDLYISMLTQFAAVSFGDHLFGHAILLPLQQRFSSQLRRAVWSEHAGVLRSLSIPVSKFLIPLEGFLHPIETNQELLSMYLSGLSTGIVKQTWCPVLYLIATHHLANYVFNDYKGNDNKEVVTNFKKKIIHRVMNMKDQTLQNHILLYKCVNKMSPLGFDIYAELPLPRSQLLQTLQR